MSGPNTNFDPVEVAVLDPEAIAAAVSAAVDAIAEATSLDDLRALRPTHTGDKSPLALANREIGALPPSAKAEAGKRVGQARGRVNQAFAARQGELEAERDERVLVEETQDLSVRVSRRPEGARHPVNLVSERVEDIFVSMGWEIAEGPEIESEWLNFDALNIGPDHPARQEADTFYVAPTGSGLVLRTHTSPVQVRTMLDREPPIYVLCPGKTFRTDDLDATHTPVFHQFEGLVVDEGITMAHLRGTLDAFVQRLFGGRIVTRLRPNYFPFTEPSAEIDCQCWVCLGGSEADVKACRSCGGTGWIELGGSGMVNRRVLRSAGIDPDRYTGFAFGLGIERSLMLRHGIGDMHDIVEGDVRFSRQFGMEI
ncbi:phenylalanine--tRNA ligase subunit alpha [Knoellia sp. S7-12]|uniref:phenylalanine--tRNA ligase subunit alpha n=1 Tax=Knoellia sp. S7-12 TaxID=3126698 RepID=UPI0033671FD7